LIEKKGGTLMKKTKKTLALTLAALLILCALPMHVLADDEGGDLSALTFNSVNILPSVQTGLATANPDSVAIEAATAVVVVEAANLDKGAATLIAFTDDDAVNPKYIYNPVVTPGVTTLATIASGTGYVSQALKYGDSVWIIDGDSAGTGDLQYVRVVISQAASGSIGGSNTVKSPAYNVVVPTNINFALNPLQIGSVSGASQITTADYKVINKSDANVLVDFAITANLLGGADFVNKSELTPNELVGADKDAYFAVLGAKDVTLNSLSFANAATDSTAAFAYDTAVSGTLIPFDTTANTAKVSFLLGGADLSTSALASGNSGKAGVASFQFYAELNTYASWAPGDITVTGAYTFQGVKSTDYTAAASANVVGLNLMSATPIADVTIAAGATEGLTIARTTAMSNGGITILLSDKPAFVTSVTAPVFSYTYPSSDYTYDSATGVLKVTDITAESTLTIVVNAGSSTYTLNWTLT
jgi:hypothetical protein